MSIDITSSSGSTKVLLDLSKVPGFTEASVRKAWFASGADLKNFASKDILRKPKSGILYTHIDSSGRRRRHRASAPGETHANMTGALRRSLAWKVKGRDLDFGYGVEVIPAPEYADWVEGGTTRMDARPSLQNAITANQRNIEGHFEKFFLMEFGQ